MSGEYWQRYEQLKTEEEAARKTAEIKLQQIKRNKRIKELEANRELAPLVEKSTLTLKDILEDFRLNDPRITAAKESRLSVEFLYDPNHTPNQAQLILKWGQFGLLPEYQSLLDEAKKRRTSNTLTYLWWKRRLPRSFLAENYNRVNFNVYQYSIKAISRLTQTGSTEFEESKVADINSFVYNPEAFLIKIADHIANPMRTYSSLDRGIDY